jgi:hypothetical protein
MLPAALFGYAPPAASVFINEIHYDNTGADAGEAVEIAGPAGTDLSGWSLVFYNGNGGAAYSTTALSGLIPDQQGGFGVLAFGYPRDGIQNGSPDGLALVGPDDAVVQFLSYEGTFTAVGGPANGLTGTDIGVSEPSTSRVGDSLQLAGTGISYGGFTWSGPIAGTFGLPNTGQTFAAAANEPVVLDCGEELTAFQGRGASRIITATDADGTVVDIAIDLVVPAPPAGGIALSALEPAGAPGGTASALLTVSPETAAGVYVVALTAANNDHPAQTGACTLVVTVVQILAIGTVQGSVGEGDDGSTHASPYAGQTVVVQGVIYQKVLARTASGGSNYGFFLQNSTAAADADPDSSDGIYVFMSRYPSLIGGYVPKVGDEVILRGRVSEYYNLTELSSASALQVLRSGVDLDDEVPAFEAGPPAELGAANRYWERREGMRALIPGGSIVLNGRNVFASTLDGEVWVATHYSSIALRTDPYTRRAFRDPHPLDDIPGESFDNGNGYRIVMGSLGLKAAAGDNSALIAPARTFDTMLNSPVGGVYCSFGKYQVQVGQQPELMPGVDPALNSPPQAFDPGLGYSLVSYNLENLYDFRDDPFDPCDFPGNPGTPDVEPPFDYVPASDAAYQARLQQIAAQIIGDLHAPDILLVQEVEDQDLASVVGGVLSFGEADNADGQPDALQELAALIAAQGGPSYEAAFDRDGADDRGIVSAFLYRADRVQLLPPSADDPVLGANPGIAYRSPGLDHNGEVQNPKALNAALPADVDTTTGVDGENVFTRAPQVGLFRVWREGIGASVFTDLYLLSNHFSSGPDTRVGQRAEQAAYNAAIVAALEQSGPQTRVLIAGDLNVYPRPDDPFTPGQALYPSDQLAALYSQGLVNLYDRLLAEAPASAYSYVYLGQAQTLDQMFASPSLLADLEQVRVAHINSDWPSDFEEDGPRGTSDHDPQVARYILAPSLGGLEELVRYLAANGAIRGNNTERILLDRLERVRRFEERGTGRADEAQLQAFVNQVQGFAPRFIDPAAADALQREAELLLKMP